MRSLLLFFCFSFISLHASDDYQVIKDENTLSILTPSLTEQKELKIRLKNGLEVYIISSPGATQSAAALAVRAGYWQEPKEIPGLAHFLEHMLFLGTKKYPEEGAYSEFIQTNGGQTNAYTTGDATVYMFSINNDSFSQALDRFSQFFIHPLLSASGVDREKNAVHQEYAKNLENDDWRQMHVLKALSNPKHPNSRFSIGNLTTLANATPENLREWYEKHYSSDGMTLVIYSNQTIDKLKKLVLEDFSDVPKRKTEKLELPSPCLSPSYRGKICYIEPIQDIKELVLSWELPQRFNTYEKEKPELLIGYVLGHEGKSSLLAELKKQGLATSLSCGSSDFHKQNKFFSIDIKLTEKGLENVNQVIHLCFTAIENLQKSGIPRYVFEEQKKAAELSYQYQSRADAFTKVSSIASGLLKEKIETYPLYSLSPQIYAPKEIQDFLNELTVDSVYLSITAPSALTGVEANKVETWFGVPYSIQSISQENLNIWKNPSFYPEIGVPEKNPFMPQSIQTKNAIHEKIEIPTPELLVDTDKQRLYWQPDIFYGVPQVAWHLRWFTKASVEISPRQAVLLDLFLYAVNEQLNTIAYPAALAGMKFTFNSKRDAVNLTLLGYNDKARVLLKEVIDSIRKLNIDQNQFNVYRKMFEINYKNLMERQAIYIGFEALNAIFSPYKVTPEEKVEAITTIEFKDLVDFSNHFFDEIYMQNLLFGNLNSKDVEKVVYLLNEEFASSKPLPKNEWNQAKRFWLGDSKGPFSYKIKSRRDGTACILVVEEGEFSFMHRAAQEILAQIIEPDFYKELRTKQQTGYIVWSWAQEELNQLIQGFAVQSARFSPESLLYRFDLFLEDFARNLSKRVSKDDFESVKQAVLNKLKRPPLNLFTMSSLLDSLAFEREGNFNWVKERIEGCEQLTYETFLSLVMQFIGQQNKKRIALMVEGDLPEDTAWDYTSLDSFEKVRDSGSIRVLKLK